MEPGNSGLGATQTFRALLRDDIRGGNLQERVRSEFNDLRDSMLSDEKRLRLRGMRIPFRWVVQWWWLLRGLILNLSPIRRILLLLGIALSCIRVGVSAPATGNVTGDLSTAGLLVILFVLMLELKDKLLARSELQEGRSVQRALMPERSPDVAGWRLWLFTRPANDVGGDLVDYMRLDEGRSTLVLADVAGKGLKAALLTAKLQATLRALVPVCTSQSELLGRVNEVIRRDSLPQFFASLVILGIESGRPYVRVVNAGHPPPLVLRRRAVEQLKKGGPALGIMSGSGYVEQVLELAHGELIVVYSDGLTEAQNPAGEFFGEDRLRSLLDEDRAWTANQLGERLVSECDLFQNPGKAHDDISLIVLQFL